MEPDILFVNPSSRQHTYQGLSSTLQALEPPFWCALPAAYLRSKGSKVAILDAEVDALGPAETAHLIEESGAKHVCIVVMGSNPSASSTPKMTHVGQVLRGLRNLNADVPVSLTGLHPAGEPVRTLKEEACDFVIGGEPFTTLEDLLRGKPNEDIRGLWYREGARIRANEPAALADPDALPMPAWDLLPMEKYRAHNWHCWDGSNRAPYGVIYSSLGCPFTCTFCNIHAMYGGQPGIRYRSAEQVVAEIETLRGRGVRNFKFLDELFAIQQSKVEEVCGLIIERDLDINAWAYARVDTVKPHMLMLMREAGIKWIAYGIESAAENVRAGVDKRYTTDKIVRAVNMARDAGLRIIGNFIFGLPDDDLTTMQQNLDMAERFNFEYANFYCAMPYPGSHLYTEALREANKTGSTRPAHFPATWSGYGQYSPDCQPLPTKHLTAAQVLAFRDAAFQHYYTRPEYLTMMQTNFGPRVIEELRTMLSIKLQRDLLNATRPDGPAGQSQSAGAV